MRIFAESDMGWVFKAFHEHGLLWAIVVAVVVAAWFVWHEVLDDPIKEHLFRRHLKRRLLKKRFVEDLVLETFEGKVELVTEELLKKKASKERILQFYGGAKLDWDVIAANGDIERDQTLELKRLVEDAPIGTNLLCATAEAGAGKSTITWRVIADLVSKKSDRLILHVLANDDADVWQRMPDFQQELKRQLLVLVDDIFRGQEATNAFIDLTPNIPLKVLATSRRNEFRSRAKRLKCACMEFQLNPPSANEKERVLRKLGKDRANLTAEQKRRLDHANQFIVLMIELEGGKELHEVIRDAVDKLYGLELNHSAYRAYGYICFAGQFSLEIPDFLLTRLDREFIGLKSRPVVEGLVFAGDRSDSVRAGHPVVAKTVSDIYLSERGYSPQQIISDLLSKVEINSAIERQFAAFLLKSVASTQSIKSELLFDLAKGVASNCVAKAQSISELVVWRNFYLLCGQSAQAEVCTNLAIVRELTSQHECSLLLYLCRERGKESDALQSIARCIRNYPEQGAGRVSYLGLVEKYARKEIPVVVREMSAWLDANPDDSYVRHAFLGFVERNRNDEIGHHINDFEKWVEKHPEESSIRAMWLGVVARNGTERKIAEAISSACKWLGRPENINDIETRKALLGLMRRRWQINPEATSNADQLLRNKGVVVDGASSEQILKSNIEWLKKHPRAKEVWAALLGLLFFLKRNGEAFALVSEAISHNRDDLNLLEHYLHALYQSDTNHEEIKGIFDRLIKDYPAHVIAKINHAGWLRDKGNLREAETYYKRLIAECPTQYGPRFGLGQLYLNEEQFSEAAKQFDYVLKMRGGFKHQMAHEGLAQALWKMGKVSEAETEIKLAIKWGEQKNQSTARFYTLLGRLYLDWITPKPHWMDAFKAFEAAKDEDPDYYGNYWGIGRAFFGLSKFAEAADALRTAIELKPDLEPPASDEIKALLDQCQQHLHQVVQTAVSENPSSRAEAATDQTHS